MLPGSSLRARAARQDKASERLLTSTWARPTHDTVARSPQDGQRRGAADRGYARYISPGCSLTKKCRRLGFSSATTSRATRTGRALRCHDLGLPVVPLMPGVGAEHCTDRCPGGPEVRHPQTLISA